MNKTHRIVWSETRQTFVVTHEKAATHGKPATTRKAVAQAVTAALLALGAGQAVGGLIFARPHQMASSPFPAG